jgi:hypothetical protein
MLGTLPARLAAVMILLFTLAQIPSLAQTEDAAISGRVTECRISGGVNLDVTQ